MVDFSVILLNTKQGTFHEQDILQIRVICEQIKIT